MGDQSYSPKASVFDQLEIKLKSQIVLRVGPFK